jgi:hypothetical protein
MALRFGSMFAEEGGSRRRTARRPLTTGGVGFANEGGRRSPRWAGVAMLTGLQLGQSGPNRGENKATVRAKIVNGRQKFF